MEPVTAILLTATLVDVAKKLYELTFMVSDDPVKEKKYKIITGNYNPNSPTKHYLLTIKGGRIIDIDPLD